MARLIGWSEGAWSEGSSVSSEKRRGQMIVGVVRGGGRDHIDGVVWRGRGQVGGVAWERGVARGKGRGHVAGVARRGVVRLKGGVR